MRRKAAKKQKNVVYPLDCNWSLYAHHAAYGTSYVNSYLHMLDIATIGDWYAMMHHIPFDASFAPKSELRVAGNAVVAFSLFRSFVKPEWEDTHNANGATLSIRHNGGRQLMLKLWKDMIIECVRGAVSDDLMGVQLTKRERPSGTWLYKLDMWLSSDVHAVPTMAACRHLFPPSAEVRVVSRAA